MASLYTIVKYSDELFHTWDEFIEKTVNGNIYHTRKFLSYHDPKKFEDTSILIYKKEVLVCVLPCCKNGDKYFSHKGATYGGPAFLKQIYNVIDLNDIINLIFEYYDNKIEFRIANSIYNNANIEIIIYLLCRKLTIKPELAWYIDTNYNIVENIKNVRNKQILKKMINDNDIKCHVFVDNNDYIIFHNMLVKNLFDKHNSSPTHNLEEFLTFKNILLDKQCLYLCKKQDILYGGVYVIKTNKKCWYTFYISKNYEIKNNMSIAYLMEKIKLDAEKENVSYIDYGISTENCGKDLNIGLAEFKEFTLGGKPSCRYVFCI